MPKRKPYAQRVYEKEQHALQVAAVEKTLKEQRHLGRLKRQSQARHGTPAELELFDACKRTDLLDGGEDRYVSALRAMASWKERYIRQPSDWKCRSYNVERQFSALARHLFAKYKVPEFMDEVWKRSNRYRQEWFINIGQGQNIRHQQGLPIPLTKRMAHEMMQAPSDLTVDQAIRWGQVISMGGTSRCARAILGTIMGFQTNRHMYTSFHCDDFWVTVIRFFVANPMLDVVHYAPIVDYINNQRFATPDPYEGVILRPAQPNFCMTGRTPDSLLAQVDAWHKNISKANRGQYCRWDPCGIRGIEVVDGPAGNRTTWRIVELLDTTMLHAEGQAMGHCVGSYASSCVTRRSAIYSMTKNNERRLTIDVSPSENKIVEVRSKGNKWPTEIDMCIVSDWAHKEGLQVSQYIKVR